MLNTVTPNEANLFICADDGCANVVVFEIMMRLLVAGCGVAQLTDMSHDNSRVDGLNWLRSHQQNEAAIERLIVVNNYRLHLTAVSLADEIKSKTKQLQGLPLIVFLNRGNAMLPIYPNNHGLGVLHELPLHLTD